MDAVDGLRMAYTDGEKILKVGEVGVEMRGDGDGDGNVDVEVVRGIMWESMLFCAEDEDGVRMVDAVVVVAVDVLLLLEAC